MSDSSGGVDWFSSKLIEMLPAAVYVCNADAVIVSFNQRATELWGRTPVLGDTDERFCGAHKLFRPDGSPIPHHETPMEWVLRTGGHARNMEMIIEQPDGTRSTVLINISPVLDEAGVQIGAVSCFQDMTFQKDAEKERLRLKDQLRQSQKLEAMEHMIGGVAHDFNNLLTPIMAGLDMAQRRQFGDEQDRRILDGALLSTVRAKKIVDRLLGLAREQPLQSTAVDVGQLVGGMTELIASAIGSKIELVVAIEPDLPNAEADANELEMAILNLVVNAGDAMADGGVMRISAAREAVAPDQMPNIGAGPFVRISVSDTGTGIDEMTLARATEPFFSTKERGKGSGLGLAMVNGFAVQSGGGIEIVSRPDMGTTIDLWLPASVTLVEPLETASEAEVVLARRVALVVDDEALIRMCTADMLVELGYEAVEADSAEAALALLDGGLSIDVLITDHLMRGMTGSVLARRLRERQDTPILIVSGFTAGDEIPAEFHRLDKPFRQSDLASSLARLMSPGA